MIIHPKSEQIWNRLQVPETDRIIGASFAEGIFDDLAMGGIYRGVLLHRISTREPTGAHTDFTAYRFVPAEKPLEHELLS